MALDVTVGGPNADSYVTLSEAEDYLEYAGYPTAEWQALDENQQEFRLKTGALLLNTLPLRGAKACREQRLEFPRWWRWDDCYPVVEDEYIAYSDIPSDCSPPEVPNDIKNAQIEVGWFAVHNGIMKQADSGYGYPPREIEQLQIGGCLDVAFFGPNDQSATLNAQWGRARITSLDTAYLLLFRWIRKVAGGVV